jgi:alanyl-tRNA synthetase
LFKIISESAVAAGVRRFEALAGCKAEAYIMAQLKQLNDIKLEFKNPKDLLGAIKNVQEKNVLLQKELDRMESAAVTLKREELYKDCLQQTTSGTNFIGEKIVGLNKAESLKQLALDLVKVKEIQLVVLCAEMNGKVHVVVSLDETKSKAMNLNASTIIKTIVSPLIQGNGGGNPTLASAVGQDATRLNEVIQSIRNLIA